MCTKDKKEREKGEGEGEGGGKRGCCNQIERCVLFLLICIGKVWCMDVNYWNDEKICEGRTIRKTETGREQKKKR